MERKRPLCLQQSKLAAHLPRSCADHLARSLGYTHVNVVGNSFGGISGAAASQLDWPELKTVSLVAPALQLLRPEQINLVRGEFVEKTVSVEGLRGFVKYVYGDRRDHLNAGMAYLLADPDPRVHVYLGSDDKEVPFELMPKDFPHDQLTVIEGGTHFSIFRHRQVTGSLKDRVCPSD